MFKQKPASRETAKASTGLHQIWTTWNTWCWMKQQQVWISLVSWAAPVEQIWRQAPDRTATVPSPRASRNTESLRTWSPPRPCPRCPASDCTPAYPEPTQTTHLLEQTGHLECVRLIWNINTNEHNFSWKHELFTAHLIQINHAIMRVWPENMMIDQTTQDELFMTQAERTNITAHPEAKLMNPN